MSENANKPAAEWLNYSAKVNLRALRLEKDDFKLLYRMISAKQRETKSFYMDKLEMLPNETIDDFLERQNRVDGAFVVSVTIHGFNQKYLTGNSVDIFDNPNTPENIRSILFSTESVPAAVLQFRPPDKIMVFLDFSRPPLLDLARLPTWPTPNESNFYVEGNHTWCTAATAELSDFFSNRRTKYDWLHAAGVYDILLFVAGIPFAISVANQAVLLAQKHLSQPLIVNSVCVYFFFLAISIYRILFTYARWVFPKIEINGRSPSLSHRVVFLSLSLGIISNTIYDTFKYLI